MWCGGASRRRAPSSIPVGYASQTGYQYDSISRVAGQREPAPPSKFSNEGGFKNSVFNGIFVSIHFSIPGRPKAPLEATIQVRLQAPRICGNPYASVP